MTATTITQQLPEKDLVKTKAEKKELNHIEAINIAIALAKIHEAATKANSKEANADSFEMLWTSHFEAIKDANLPQGRQGDLIQEVKRQLIRFRPTLDLRAKKTLTLSGQNTLENIYANEDKATIYIEATTKPMHPMHEAATTAMDLEAHNLPELAEDFTNAYINQRQEIISQGLWRLYKAERAFSQAVKAHQQGDEAATNHYWSLAEGYLNSQE